MNIGTNTFPVIKTKTQLISPEEHSYAAIVPSTSQATPSPAVPPANQVFVDQIKTMKTKIENSNLFQKNPAAQQAELQAAKIELAACNEALNQVQNNLQNIVELTRCGKPGGRAEGVVKQPKKNPTV